MKEILAEISNVCLRAVLLENGVPMRYEISGGSTESVAGNIYKGKVENVISGMQAAFVNIGLEKNAFLYAGDVMCTKGKDVPIEKLLSPGDEILVQVMREAHGTKGVRVTQQLTLPGKNLVLLPYADYTGVSKKLGEDQREKLRTVMEEAGRGHGFIVRTAARNVGANVLRAEAEYLENEWAETQKKACLATAPALLRREGNLMETLLREWMDESVDRMLINDRAAYETAVSAARFLMPGAEEKIRWFRESRDLFAYYSLNAKLEKLLQRRVWLDSGAYLVIDQTEALTAIDVNTGKFVGGEGLEETILQTNLEAAREIARQLVLRNLGGIVIIDFIDMATEEERQKVLHELERAVQTDPVKTNIVGFTGLGLVEMTRKKTGRTLSETVCRECPTCRGEGRIRTAESIAWQLRADLLRLLSHVQTAGVLVRLRPHLGEQFDFSAMFAQEPLLSGVVIGLLKEAPEESAYALTPMDPADFPATAIRILR